MSDTPTQTDAPAEQPPAQSPAVQAVRAAAQAVRDAEALRRRMIRQRNAAIRSAYFDHQLQVHTIAAYARVSPGTVQGALQDERARRDEAAAAREDPQAEPG